MTNNEQKNILRCVITVKYHFPLERLFTYRYFSPGFRERKEFIVVIDSHTHPVGSGYRRAQRLTGKERYG